MHRFHVSHFSRSVLAVLVAAMTLASSAFAEIALYSFQSAPDANSPDVRLTVGKHGVLYGVTPQGGQYNGGAIFQLSPPATDGAPWTETVLFSFGGSDGDHAPSGLEPMSSLLLDKDGNLYGTAFKGGKYLFGTIFELSPPAVSGGAWTFSLLYKFTGKADGEWPLGLTFGLDGSLYGITTAAGEFGGGTVFRMNNLSGTWHYRVLYNFDDETPVGTLLADKSGNLYGATQQNYSGPCVCGAIFEVSPIPGGGWTESTIYTFQGSSANDGADPDGNLILDSAGNLYGETGGGGTGTGSICEAGCGTVFELFPGSGSWTESILYSFPATGEEGVNPAGGLVFDKYGNLYGTAAFGGLMPDWVPQNAGVVFELSRSTTTSISPDNWTQNLLYGFGGGWERKNDGSNPRGGVTFDNNAALYGTTSAGGLNGLGTFFRLQP